MARNQPVENISVGDWIGDYQVERRIRAGGMATLYLARRSGVAGFSRVAAIKVIHPHLLQDEGLVRMFVDEARILSRIAHPNVVHVEEFCESDGLLYLVLEYVAGCSASQLMGMLRKQEEKLPIALAVHIAVKTAEGLHAAHETIDEEGRPLGIVHRDVSPSNILISTSGNIKLIDFGIAKARGLLRDTWTGHSLKGKLRYMCPEQARGERIDRRADIYSLGLVLWELLTEEPAFRAESELALLNMVRAPQLRSMEEYRRDVPPALGEAIQLMTSVEPKDRPADAYAAARMLAAAIPESLFVAPHQLGECVRRRNAWAAEIRDHGGREHGRPGSATPLSPIQGQSEPAPATGAKLHPSPLERQPARAPAGASGSGTGAGWRMSLECPPLSQEGGFDPALGPPRSDPAPRLKRMTLPRVLVWTRGRRNVAVATGLVLGGLIAGFVVARAGARERSAEQPSTGALPVESRPPVAHRRETGAASRAAAHGATRPTGDGGLGVDGSRTGGGPTASALEDRNVEEEQDRSSSSDRPAHKSPSPAVGTRRPSQRDRRRTVAARREAPKASEARPSDSGSPAQDADGRIIRVDGVSLARDADAPAGPAPDDRRQRRRQAPIRVGKTPLAEGFEEE